MVRREVAHNLIAEGTEDEATDMELRQQKKIIINRNIILVEACKNCPLHLMASITISTLECLSAPRTWTKKIWTHCSDKVSNW